MSSTRQFLLLATLLVLCAGCADGAKGVNKDRDQPISVEKEKAAAK